MSLKALFPVYGKTGDQSQTNLYNNQTSKVKNKVQTSILKKVNEMNEIKLMNNLTVIQEADKTYKEKITLLSGPKQKHIFCYIH